MPGGGAAAVLATGGQRLGLDGPYRARGWAGGVRVEVGRAFGFGPNEKDRIDLFSEIIFQCENKSRKSLENVLRHEKYLENSQNSRKIPRDRLEHEQSK